MEPTHPSSRPDYWLADQCLSLVWAVLGVLLILSDLLPEFDPVPALADSPEWQLVVAGAALIVGPGLIIAGSPHGTIEYAQLKVRIIGSGLTAGGLVFVAGMALQQVATSYGWGVVGIGGGIYYALRARATWGAMRRAEDIEQTPRGRQ